MTETYRDLVVAYKRFFGTEEGKQVLYDLMSRYHILQTHKGDAFAEGQRSVVVEILHKVNLTVEQFDQLLKGETE
ncbi:MAG: hypothetical protein IPL34_20485 [Thiofilum sp.]|uniref:Bbp19 family protein n=1 Tax=Thiofilum sp. TaxID=2212733 RepID=UPI0025E82CA3|nr:hypothetical protein [Thiofilum sp.]MBK8455661.1 hypothetical protein [Thiofilum sp.]